MQEQQASDKGVKGRRERPGSGERHRAGIGTLPGRWQGHQRWAGVGSRLEGHREDLTTDWQGVPLGNVEEERVIA